MKKTSLLTAIFFNLSILAVCAQKAPVSEIVQSKRYVFQAETMSPMRGGVKQLSLGYSLTIKGDTLVSELPYAGKLNQPSALNYSGEGGLKFTSNEFTYAVKKRKKDGWEVTIKLKNNRQVRELKLTIFENGRTDVRVTCLDRDPISYNGYIEQQKK